MKRLTVSVLMLVLLLCGSVAGAEWKEDRIDAYVTYASPGMTVMPTYNDYSGNFGSRYTKDMFDITYATTEADVTVDEKNGLVTIGENAKYKDTVIDVTYTRKTNAKNTKTFQKTIEVVRPLKKLVLSEDALYVPIDATSAAVNIELHGNTTVMAVSYALYEDTMISPLPISLHSGDNPKSIDYNFKPLALGETSIKFVSYNGIVKVLPVYVVDKIKKLSFGISRVECEPGDVIDLGIDLGNGPYGPKAYTMSCSTYRDGAYYSSGAEWYKNNQFTTEQGGEYELRMSRSGFETAHAYIVVYDNAVCTDIRLSADLSDPNARKAEVLLYDAQGERIQRPIKIAQTGKVVTLKNGEVTVEESGSFSIVVTNPDGSKISKDFEAKRAPKRMFLNCDSHYDMTVGQVHDLVVTYDVEGDFPYTITYHCWNYNVNGPEPIRVEGNRIIAQAVGQARVTVSGGGVSESPYIYVREGVDNISLDLLEDHTAVGIPIRAVVVDEDDMIIPSVISGDPEEVSVGAGGWVTPLVPGRIIITATTEDGRSMQRDLMVTEIPTKMTAANVLITEGSSTAYSGVVTEPICVEDWALVVSVVDTNIAQYNQKERRFYAVSPGVTQGIVRCNYGGAEARFIIEVVERKLYIGNTNLSVPYGFAAYLPIVTDEKGKEVAVTWSISQENLVDGNPYASAFMLEENLISCVWPEGSCIVTGITKTGEVVKVKVNAYRISESISISPSSVQVNLGEKVEVSVVNHDSNAKIPAIYWAAETAGIINFKKEVQGKLTNELYGSKAGTTKLTAVLDNGAYAECAVTVVDPIPRIPGDANDDGKVDAKDALLIMQYDAGWHKSINGWQGDVNADGKTNLQDAVLILKHAAGLDVQLRQYIPTK